MSASDPEEDVSDVNPDELAQMLEVGWAGMLVVRDDFVNLSSE